MNNFVVRTISATVYATLVVSSILLHPVCPYYFGALFLVITLLAIREFHHLMESSHTLTTCACVAGGLLFAAMWALYNIPGISFSSLVYLLVVDAVVLIVAMINELFACADNPIRNWGNLLVSYMMIAVPFALMNAVMDYSEYALLALFVAIWINDSGAYIVGCLTAKRAGGNHKMFPRVSPAKSWEGLIGGIVVTLLAGWVFYRVGWLDRLWLAITFAVLVSAFGTLGDLMESLFKRTIGVKDSGHIMPGHGGALDRFDSLLLATPVIFLLLLFC